MILPQLMLNFLGYIFVPEGHYSRIISDQNIKKNVPIMDDLGLLVFNLEEHIELWRQFQL